MKIIQNLADPSRYSVKCPYAMTPTRVVVHNTANDAPAANEIAYMIRNDNEVSFHYAVDEMCIRDRDNSTPGQRGLSSLATERRKQSRVGWTGRNGQS